LEICEERDRKGLYANARAGIVKEFTGISDPYGASGPEVIVNTAESIGEEAAQEVILHWERQGFIGVNAQPPGHESGSQL
jgi:sulfate adenylyltransferase